MDIQERIEEIEKEIRETPYHKGTEHHIGLLRARIAKLQDEILDRQTKRGRGGGGTGFAIKKAGDATVVLVGPPSVGKSTLLNALTNAKSPVAPYAFTTVTVIPGMMDYQGARIQILDVPGLIEGASKGKGRGREILSVVRGADVIVFITEVGKEKKFKEMEDELYHAGVRINSRPPHVRIEKKLGGGIVVRALVKQDVTLETIKQIAQEFRLKNAEIAIKERLTFERLIDAFAANRVYVDVLYIVNKSDTINYHALMHDNWIPVSAKTKKGLDDLKNAMWEKLRFVRAYLTQPGAKPDYDAPLIMKEGETLQNVAEKIGREFAERVKGVRISGPGSKFDLQEVPLTTKIVDRMEVTFEV